MSVIIRRWGSGGKSHSFWAMYSLKMSFCRVPRTRAQSTPCSSAATRKKAKTTWAGPLMVIDTDTSPRGMPSNRRTMSSAPSTATPQTPTSPRARAWSESSPRRVGMSKATDTPCCPCSSRWRKRRLVSSTPANPANWRMVHGFPRYPVGWMPRV